MHVRRWLMLALAPVVMTALPACVSNGPILPLRPKVEPFVPPPVKTTSSKARPNGDKFASLKPGESVALNPVVAESRHQLVPIEEPADPTPTVQPPAPLPPLEVEPMTPLVFAIRAFQDNQPDKAVEYLKEFDKPNQELLLQLIPAVVQASKANLGKPDADEAAALAKQFEAAAATVLKRAGFGIRKATICLRVNGFGWYDPVPDAAGLRRGMPYWVYLELDNVPCLPDVRPEDGAKGFVTRLECEMRVTDEFGQTVEIQDVKTKTLGHKSTTTKSEFTRSPVRDYFLAAVLQTPTRPGAYTVTFEIRDPRTGRSVSKPIAFRVQ